ncbi:MAG: BstXI family restriction endonuclease [Planctomycetota bacterium]
MAAAARVEGDAQGIRFFEYASTEEADGVVIHLAMLAWHTAGIDDVRTDGRETGVSRPLLDAAEAAGLWDRRRLERLGVLSDAGAICPLCRGGIKASELMNRIEQVQGREVFDLTVTEVNLFHMQDLKPGEFNHRTYAVGWGHHHCNAVARDHGLEQTLDWMAEVLRRNGADVRR